MGAGREMAAQEGLGVSTILGAAASRGCAGALGTSPSCALCPVPARHEREVVCPRHPPCTPGCSADLCQQAASPHRSPRCCPTHGAVSPLGTGVRMVTPAGSGEAVSRCHGGRLGHCPALPCPKPPWVHPPPLISALLAPEPQLQPRRCWGRPSSPPCVRASPWAVAVIPPWFPAPPPAFPSRAALFFPSSLAPPPPQGRCWVPAVPTVCVGRARGDSGLVPRPPAATKAPLRCRSHPETQVWELIYSAAA